MRRFLAIAIPVFVIGFISGNAFWYLFSPLWIDREVNETLPAEFMLSELKSGQFSGADAAHQGSGKAAILQGGAGTNLLRLTDFEVTNGPDLEVWLVKARDISTSSDVTDSESISLGPLKGNKGEQTYVIPPDAETGEFSSAVIWCEQFGVLFAAATLE